MAEHRAGSGSTSTGCVIVGGGPAGMVLGLLLARRGVRVQMLETRADFERDFRGDTIHPAVMEMHEAGIAQLQQSVAQIVPWLADRVGALDDWKKTHMLTVQAGTRFWMTAWMRWIVRTAGSRRRWTSARSASSIGRPSRSFSESTFAASTASPMA